MTYQATVIQVMIASPSDVLEERNEIEKIIHQWNYTHSSNSNVVLIPVKWETHSAPDLGGRPQELINNRILNKCDLLVGIFWTRIGSQTGGFASGTVEEIERHVTNKKPVMLYFSNKPVIPDSIDQDQYTELKKFKETCLTRGLVSFFDSSEHFRNIFTQQLQIILSQHFDILLNNYSKKLQVKSEYNLTDYAKYLIKECSKDSGGVILKLKFIGGDLLQTNGKSFSSDNGNLREFAKWESALSQLLESKYVNASDDKGTSFKITNEGFEIADTIAETIFSPTLN
jgi:hypothetical protein